MTRAWCLLVWAGVIGTVALVCCSSAQPTVGQQLPAGDRQEATTAAIRQQLDEYLTRIEAFGFTGAALVLRGDEVLVQKGCGYADREKRTPNTPQTLFDIGSVTKPFTAAAIVKLDSAGKLNVQDRISKHFRGVPNDKAPITIHDLLTHTSGLPRGIAIEPAAQESREAAIRQILALPLDFKPGERWGYSNAGYQLLACLIEEISGERFEEYMKKSIFRPVGMAHASFLHDPQVANERVAIGYSSSFPGGVVGPADKQWYHWGLRGCGGILASIEDLHHWEQALRGEAFLSEAEKEKLFTPYVQSSAPGRSYGYGWEIAEDFLGVPARFVGHGGDTRGFECKFYRFPEKRIAIAVCSNTNDHYCWWIPHHLFSILVGRQFGLPPKVVKLPTERLMRCEGTYKADEGVEVDLQATEGRMLLTPVGQPAIDLLSGAGGGPPRPAADGVLPATEANRRADSAMGALVAGDLKTLADLVDPKWPDWPQQLRDWMDKEAQQRGQLRAHRVLGTSGDDVGSPWTFVELRFEKGAERVALGWNRDRITFFDFPSARVICSYRLVPESETRFNSYDIATSNTLTLEFEATRGDITRARLRMPDGRTIALQK